MSRHALAGRRRVRPAALGVALAMQLALGSCGGAPDAETDEQPLDVLLITIDSARQDFFGVYGFRSPYAQGASDSPRLDRLADEGVVMEDACSTSSWTLPSHASILTGQPEIVHGVDLESQGLDPSCPLLSQRLKKAGYRTAGFYSGPFLEPRYGFGRGFDRYDACYGDVFRAAAARDQEAQANLERIAKTPGFDQDAAAAVRREAEEAQRGLEVASRRDHSSGRVADGVIDELRRAHETGTPLFVFAHFFDPHHDYVPVPPYDRAFDPDYDGGITGEDFMTDPAIARHDPDRPRDVTRVVSERDLDHVRMLYAGEIAATDAQIGRMLDELERLGLARHTLVIVTADHGDEFFEHGGIGHRSTLYRELVRVPLILRLPGVLPAGVRVPGLVSTIDIVPTVLQALRLSMPGSLVGRSLLGPILEEPDPGRGVLGRLVRHERGYLEVPARDGGKPTLQPASLFTLEETYRTGTVMLSRSRSWVDAFGPTTPRAKRTIDRRNRLMRAREELHWIDLETSPTEDPAQASQDFSDPRALAALRSFHDLYGALLERRGTAERLGQDGVSLATLDGLGYSDAGDLAADDLLLFPAPGSDVLAAADAR